MTNNPDGLSDARARDVRLRIFLEILAASCGQADASDYRWNWINAFCGEHEGCEPDTFNTAHEAGYTTVSHDSDTDTSTVYLTDAGRAYLATPPASTSTATAAGEWQSPDLRDIYGDVERFRAHDLGNNRHRDLLRGALDMLRAADMELIDGIAATLKAASKDSLATAKARLSIASVKGRNSGRERIEVITDDVAVLIAAHSDLGRKAASEDEPRYLIRKGGYYYRPNAHGYTSHTAEAGRYTLAEAIKHSHPNGPDGPRDGMDYVLDTFGKAASEDGATGCNCAARFYGDDRNAHQLSCAALAASPTDATGAGDWHPDAKPDQVRITPEIDAALHSALLASSTEVAVPVRQMSEAEARDMLDYDADTIIQTMREWGYVLPVAGETLLGPS